MSRTFQRTPQKDIRLTLMRAYRQLIGSVVLESVVGVGSPVDIAFAHQRAGKCEKKMHHASARAHLSFGAERSCGKWEVRSAQQKPAVWRAHTMEER